jgi:hypothetical protein
VRRNSKAGSKTSSRKLTGTSTNNATDHGVFWSALYATYHGYVDAEGIPGPQDTEGQLCLWFVWQGRIYMRTFDRFYGPRWAARLAAEFAQDVAEGKE